MWMRVIPIRLACCPSTSISIQPPVAIGFSYCEI